MVCIIATKDALRALLWRPNRHARFGVEGRSVFSIASPLYAAVEKYATGAAAWCRCGRSKIRPVVGRHLVILTRGTPHAVTVRGSRPGNPEGERP